MARILLVRHGETEWNKAHRNEGHRDNSLTTVGLQQAKALSQRLSKQKINVIYSSDLKRAVHTAEIIALEHNAELVTCEELREIDFGEFEGLTGDEIRQRYPHFNWSSLQHHPHEKLPSGESISQLAARVSQFEARLRTHTGEGAALIVAHGVALSSLLCLLLSLSVEHWWQIRLDNASLTILETYPEGAVLSLLNDVSHLENLKNERL